MEQGPSHGPILECSFIRYCSPHSFSIVLHLDVIAILAMSSFCVIYLIIKNIQTIILILGRYKHPCMFFLNQVGKDVEHGFYFILFFIETSDEWKSKLLSLMFDDGFVVCNICGKIGMWFIRSMQESIVANTSNLLNIGWIIVWKKKHITLEHKYIKWCVCIHSLIWTFVIWY